jgi:hypothetical protein
MKAKTIALLRQQQEATRGASEWAMLEEEIQSLLDEEEVEPCYQGRFWDNTTKKLVRWHELTGENTHNEEEDINTTSY